MTLVRIDNDHSWKCAEVRKTSNKNINKYTIVFLDGVTENQN